MTYYNLSAALPDQGHVNDPVSPALFVDRQTFLTIRVLLRSAGDDILVRQPNQPWLARGFGHPEFKVREHHVSLGHVIEDGLSMMFGLCPGDIKIDPYEKDRLATHLSLDQTGWIPTTKVTLVFVVDINPGVVLHPNREMSRASRDKSQQGFCAIGRCGSCTFPKQIVASAISLQQRLGIPVSCPRELIGA